MKIAPLNLNSPRQGVNFKGKTVADFAELKAANRFINCKFNNLADNLSDSINKKAPNLIKDINGEKYIADDNLWRKAVSSLKSFFSMPFDILDGIAKKFPNSSLNNAKFMRLYREEMQFEDEVRALQGLQRNGIKFVLEQIPDKNYPTGACNDYCRKQCKNIEAEFNKLLNSSMADNKAVYDTKKERFWTRIISGFTAAMFLGNDFYNKSIQKGRSEEEAKREQHLKQGQEIKENICEGITQFAVFACFSKIVNKSIWGSAVIGAVIGLVSRVLSRLSSNMPIRRIKVPPQNSAYALTMKEFAQASKEGKIQEAQNKKQASKSKEKHKKPLLSPRNILIFCLASIAAGYSLKFLKGHTQIGNMIAQKLQSHNDKLNAQVIEDIIVPKEELRKLAHVLKNSNEEHLANNIASILNEDAEETIFLGQDFVTKSIFGAQVKLKDLKRLKTAPFRFLKELISYPYKIASKLENAIRNSGSKGKIKPDENSLPDKYDIMNLYKRFMEFDKKYGDDERVLCEEFGKYLKKMRLLSNNDVTSSSCNNSKIAVVAQTLGTLTGMWFNMNDEYNSSIRNGSSKYEAEKDARLRGINKFFRMTVQLIISGSLNDIFQKQYDESLSSAALIVAASTILTDAASRVLTGMPSRKMTKEELENYQKSHKEGILKGYYKFIDKLAS